MKFEKILHIILIGIPYLSACSSHPSPDVLQKGVHISLSADSSSVELHRVQPDVLAYLQGDSLSRKDWQSLFAVYPDSPDPELRDLQIPLEGDYVLRDSTIVFLPHEGFKKDSAYFARFYSRKILGTPSDVVLEGNLSGQAKTVEYKFRR